MEPKDIEYFEQLLKGMLDDILRQGEETLEDMTDSGEVYADPADRATAESDRAFTLRLRDRERKLIKKIQEALQRIEDGSYGVCEDCGEDISVPRLKARPVTTLCIQCKSKREDEENQRGD
jgi:DnaK suppressor protein